MEVLVIYSDQYKIGAVGNSDSCESRDFLMSLEANYQASADGLFVLLDRISKDGLRDIPSKLSRRVDENENIYELRKGDLRLFYFKTEVGFLIICTSALIKKTQAVDQKHVNKAIKLKHAFLDAVKGTSNNCSNCNQKNVKSDPPKRSNKRQETRIPPRGKDMKGQPGFFDLAERHDKLTQMRDPLVVLKEEIDWEAFRADLAKLHEKDRKSAVGAKPWDVVRMFKLLVLQQTYNLSDEQIEYQIRDRLSFMRFLGLRLEDKVPDAKTVWLFRERLATHGLTEKLFARFHEQLAGRGFVAQGGQMIDATFVEVPRQRNSREENALIKEDAIPIEWGKRCNKNKLAQKDVCARWTKKGDETHYGYKNHGNADDEHKLGQSYAVSDAAVHDSQVFDELLDHTVDDK